VRDRTASSIARNGFIVHALDRVLAEEEGRHCELESAYTRRLVAGGSERYSIT